MTYKPRYSWKANSNIDGGKGYTNVTFETGDAGKVPTGSFATVSTFEIENKRNEKSTTTELVYADTDYETFEEFYWEEEYEQIAAQELPDTTYLFIEERKLQVKLTLSIRHLPHIGQ